MAEGRPLAGKRVVVTRAPEQAGELAAWLDDLGAEILFVPVVRYEPALDGEPLDEVLRSLSEFDWLILSSQNVVRFVSERLQALGVSAQGGQPFPKVAAVGTATAAAARQEGWPVHFVASCFQGTALTEELREHLRGCRVLLPRSDRAGADLPDALRDAGAEVTEAVAYRTLSAGGQEAVELAGVREGAVDVLTFASPSAFHAFAETVGTEALQQLAGRAAIAAIGPVTAEAIRAAGLEVHVEADEATAAGLAQAIARYFEKQKATSGAGSS